MISLSSNDTFEYVIESDRESEEPTVWILKPLTLDETAECENLLSGTIGGGIKTGDFKIRVLKLGLKGWRNLNDGDGSEVETKLDRQGRISDDILSRIHPDHRTELHSAIWERVSVNEEDEKN